MASMLQTLLGGTVPGLHGLELRPKLCMLRHVLSAQSALCSTIPSLHGLELSCDTVSKPRQLSNVLGAEKLELLLVLF